MRYIIIVLCLLAFAVVSVFGFTEAGFAQDKEKVIKTVSNGVNGEISGIGKNYISVVYGRDKEKGVDYEMLLPIDKNIQVEHKKSLGDMKVGDTVSVAYEDVITEDFSKKQTMKRKAKVVTFVKSAPPQAPEPSVGLAQ